jgi:hypothetical protein
MKNIPSLTFLRLALPIDDSAQFNNGKRAVHLIISLRGEASSPGVSRKLGGNFWQIIEIMG